MGRRVVWASDEYYLLARLAFPEVGEYEGCAQHENGVGMVRSFEEAFDKAPGTGRTGRLVASAPARSGFFAWVEGAPAEGYRAPRTLGASALGPLPSAGKSITILTGSYGAAVLAPMLKRHGFSKARVLTVENEFFGGNIAVAGLMTGPDLSRTLVAEGRSSRYLLPDVCLSKGRFIDGSSVEDLPVPVEVVPTDGASLRSLLEAAR